ncbi:RNA polymerase sigma factor [Flexivirga oryzae]|uniref:RNA polymerase sigma-70 factor (ECF subfamily) n=1 Tax=Flexivirga oryzae TaxID=1794944 RepID=A0A839N7F5_9MICO|nr:RNA polymerase sigma factor [Flexivirga oryzae]MBB2890671.1 RNA polymerase sigma-70 factor (ECF subfamily) [Flexivirga oryzae]
MQDFPGSTVTDPSDAELARVMATGDCSALETLYRRHAPWLTVRLLRRCNDKGLVAEVIQDTFLAVWRGADRYREDGEVAGWLWGVAIRRLASSLRKSRHREIARDPWTVLAGDAVAASAEDRVLLGVEYGDLGTALTRLSPQLRAVVQATVLDGLTTREAARLLGVPSATVRTRLFRAKAQLRRHPSEEMS